MTFVTIGSAPPPPPPFSAAYLLVSGDAELRTALEAGARLLTEVRVRLIAVGQCVRPVVLRRH